MTLNRRNFIMGCSTAIAAMAGSRLTQFSFAQSGHNEVLLVVFLRGAWDALSVVPVLDGKDRGLYEAARPKLRIPLKGKDAALPLNAQFGLHRSLEPLLEFYQGRQLAVVHAVGMPTDTRSHFDAMNFMELGTPGEGSTPSGWLTRHLQVVNPGVSLPAASLGDNLAASLLGSREAVSMRDPADFTLTDDADFMAALTRMYAGPSWLHQAGSRTLLTLREVQRAGLKEYKPSAGYPEGNDFANSLKSVAQLIKAQLGLRVATVDLGGWDTHEWQGEGGGGYLADLLRDFGAGLAAFWRDLGEHAGRTTVVVMSEFGRRLAENAQQGTDHGHGSAMLLLGGNVQGGKVYGRWPGLAPEQLYDRADLAVTTDYRQVLGEILLGRLGNSKLEAVFPGFKMGQPLGIVRS